MRSTSLTRLLAVLGAGALLAAGVSPSSGAPSAKHESAAAVPEVVASGLNNPRGLAFAPDGSLYVAEAGTGGSGPCFAGPEGPSCFGMTGSVTRIGRHGQERVLTGLPSIGVEGSGDAGIGPSDVAFRGNDKVYVTVGLGADPAIAEQLPALGEMGQLVLAKPSKGTWSTVVDLADFETDNDPNEDGPDTNPNSVLVSQGRAIVSDAGANDLLRIKQNGSVEVIATFPNVDVPGPGGAPFSMDFVPTTVAKGPDGALYVGQLTGFPFPLGGAKVYRIGPSGTEVVAEGFTNIISIAFDGAGNLYVLEIFHNGLLSGDPTGALIRVAPNGDQTIVMSDGLITPGGLAVRGANAYVSNCGTCAAGGEVLRIPLS